MTLATSLGKSLGAAALLALGSLAAVPAAYAYDGCGWGYHAVAFGACRPNVRPVPAYGVVYAPRPVYGYGYGYGYRPYRPGFSVSFRPF